MMKEKRLLPLMLCVAGILCGALSGCSTSSGTSKTPQDVIADAYGNEEYRITFSSEGLNAPLADMTYTASKTPVLPVPERVGYIFSGWYMDKSYTVPYIDGILCLYMRDVTLYAKWENESFEQNGTYDVEFSASILEDTVVKGSLTDACGGYRDFTDSLLKDEIYIEKTDEGLMLRLQYDTVKTLPMSSSLPVYDVSVSSRMDSSIYVKDRIDSYADPVKTLFISIDGMDLSQTLYLDVQTSNWDVESLDTGDRYKTTTRYTVAFDFTRIIGFSRSYVNPDVPLEEGYYLAKTYYAKIDNKESMSSSFNPVYAYIYSDGNRHYTLIKQNLPYAGLISESGSSLENTAKNFYERLMSLIPIQLAYELTNPPTGTDAVTSEYYPATYGATSYNDYAVEYHADSGKFYNIYDLGDSVRRTFGIMGGATGFMEAANGMSYFNQILRIDPDSLIRLAGVDYEPLTGDAYQYEESMYYYPGDTADMNTKGTAYDLTVQAGVSARMVNFFFSVADLSMPNSQRKQYSSRVTVTPTAATAAVPISEARYALAEFRVNAAVYGYDCTDSAADQLYMDSLTVQTLGDTAMRQNIAIANGKSCKPGDTVNLSELYAEKCDSTADFSAVRRQVFRMTNGKVDFSAPVALNGAVLTFENDVAVLFEWDVGESTHRSLVELATYSDPVVDIQSTTDFPYSENPEGKVGDSLAFPYLTYSWMGKRGKLIDYYYADTTSQEQTKCVDITHAAVFTVKDGRYTLYSTQYNQSSFEIPGEEIVILYELTNRYGERYCYTFPFSFSSRILFTVEDGNGNVVSSGNVRYGDDGQRREESTSLGTRILTADNYQSLLCESFRMCIGSYRGDFELTRVSVITDAGGSRETVPAGTDPDSFREALWNRIKDTPYAVLSLVYGHGDDTVTATFVYRISFSGRADATVFGYNAYFANHTYTEPEIALYGSDGTNLGVLTTYGHNSAVSINRGTRYTNITAREPGDYTLTREVYVNRGTVGFRLTFSETMHVLREFEDVRVTYVTDASHPFADGTTEKTVTYNLSGDVTTLRKDSFAASVPTTDVLNGWALTEGSGKRAYEPGVVVDSFADTFNDTDVRLYAIWDPGLTLTVMANGEALYTVTYYRDGYANTYTVKTDFSVQVPDGYQLAGWRSVLFGDKIVQKETSVSEVDRSNPDSFIVEAVFKKEYTVRYSVDSAYSTEYFRNDIVLDGDAVPSAARKMNLTCKKEGYVFAGWRVQGDESGTVYDLMQYTVTGNVTLEAVFIPAEEAD